MAYPKTKPELYGSQLWVGLNEVKPQCPHCCEIISGSVIDTWVKTQQANAKPEGAKPVSETMQQLREITNLKLARDVLEKELKSLENKLAKTESKIAAFSAMAKVLHDTLDS